MQINRKVCHVCDYYIVTSTKNGLIIVETAMVTWLRMRVRHKPYGEGSVRIKGLHGIHPKKKGLFYDYL